MCSPSALIRVNYLVIRYLHFRNARGDLQEGHFTLPDANCLSFRAQNRHFCALLPSGTPVFGHFEHKIEVFVLFWPSEPPFSGISSTKSRFLCAFCPRDPHFRAFRVQNRHFCALFAFGTPIFRHFEHKIEVFVRFCPPKPSFSGFSSTKSGFLCAFTLRDPHFRPFRAQNRGFCAFLPASFSRLWFLWAPLPAASSRWRSATAAPLTRSFATAPWPATNLIRRRKVLRFG